MAIPCVRTLDIKILAEGVENEQELTVLRATGISLFQDTTSLKPALMSLPPVPLGSIKHPPSD